MLNRNALSENIEYVCLKTTKNISLKKVKKSTVKNISFRRKLSITNEKRNGFKKKIVLLSFHVNFYF